MWANDKDSYEIGKNHYNDNRKKRRCSWNCQQQRKGNAIWLFIKLSMELICQDWPSIRMPQRREWTKITMEMGDGNGNRMECIKEHVCHVVQNTVPGGQQESRASGYKRNKEESDRIRQGRVSGARSRSCGWVHLVQKRCVNKTMISGMMSTSHTTATPFFVSGNTVFSQDSEGGPRARQSTDEDESRRIR